MIKNALYCLLVGIALVAGGYYWGNTASNNSHDAAQLKKEREEFAQFKREVQRGQTATTRYQEANATLTQDFNHLQEAFNAYKKRAPILARPTAPRTCPQQPDEPNEAQPESEPGLSAGAIWMWNSALAGQDRPVGACGLADQSTGACAADTGLSLQDAWDNQAVNARLCAEDRQQHQHLIDFIKKGQQHAN